MVTRRGFLKCGTGAIAVAATAAEVGAWAEFLDWMRRKPKFFIPSETPNATLSFMKDPFVSALPGNDLWTVIGEVSSIEYTLAPGALAYPLRAYEVEEENKMRTCMLTPTSFKVGDVVSIPRVRS